MSEKSIYLDYNATTPVDPRVLEAMLPYFSQRFGNPSAIYAKGRESAEAVRNARGQVAALIGADPQEIIFTGSGTESDNLALKGFISASSRKGKVVVSAIEHPAVLRAAEDLSRQGIAIQTLPVTDEGYIDLKTAERIVDRETILVSVMLANNETGVIQPVAELGAICRRKGAVLHTDAVQAAGKIPVSVDALGVGLLSMSAHKIYGPKGVGALYVRKGLDLAPLIPGGGQERGLRSGTENVPGIVGFGEACRLAGEILVDEAKRWILLRDRLLERIREACPTVVVNTPDRALPNTLNISFPGIDLKVLGEILEKIACSAGAACASHEKGTSHVLAAMGRRPDLAARTIRLSLGRFTTPDEIEIGANEIVAELRSFQRGNH